MALKVLLHAPQLVSTLSMKREIANLYAAKREPYLSMELYSVLSRNLPACVEFLLEIVTISVAVAREVMRDLTAFLFFA